MRRKCNTAPSIGRGWRTDPLPLGSRHHYLSIATLGVRSMNRFRLSAVTLVGAASLAALASATASAASKAEEFGQLNSTTKNFVAKNYFERAERRKTTARWRRTRSNLAGSFSMTISALSRTTIHIPDTSPQDATRSRAVGASTYKSKSPDDGFGTYIPAKLVKLHDPLADAAKPYKVLASSVLHELRNAETATRVSEGHREAIVSFYRNRSFEPMWITSEGLNDKARRAARLSRPGGPRGAERRRISTRNPWIICR